MTPSALGAVSLSALAVAVTFEGERASKHPDAPSGLAGDGTTAGYYTRCPLEAERSGWAPAPRQGG